MTRIWYVAPGELDNQRLLGAHREFHLIQGLLNQGRKWNGWEQPQYRQAFYRVHGRLVREMEARGYEHTTPAYIPKDYTPFGPQEPYPATPKMVEDDRWALICRWGGIYKGCDPMPNEYINLIEKYKEQGGCLHDGPTLREGLGNSGERYTLCLLCKAAAYDYYRRRWIPTTHLESVVSPGPRDRIILGVAGPRTRRNTIMEVGPYNEILQLTTPRPSQTDAQKVVNE